MIDRHGYLEELAKLLAVSAEVLTDDFMLQDSQLWDSLSIVSTIASLERYYHVIIKGQEIEKCQTVGDIFKLVEDKTTDVKRPSA